MHAFSGYNPDVLSCLASLSSDEVFTPPGLANAMLDLLPGDVWSNPGARFLDPGCKSGVFLREVTKRLDAGLQPIIKDRTARINHILTKQVFGLATTELTALLSRRSVYCSKAANGRYSVCEAFDEPDGNIRFVATQHSWENGTCTFCGASEAGYSRDSGLESHAYGFIHQDNLDEVFPMRFDVILGNPPYQIGDGGHGASASPIYHKFVEAAITLNPRYVTMITPSRWFAGGKNLDDFRERMLADKRLRHLVDYPKLYDGFPGVKIRGGVSYFLWDRDYNGPCLFQTMWDGKPVGPPVARDLNAYDVLVRRNEAVPILEKVQAFRTEAGEREPTLDARVSSLRPFGFRTYFHGVNRPTKLKDPIKLYGSQRISWVERAQVERNAEWVDRWKVLMSRVQGTSAAVETMFLPRPIVSGPGEACTETYLVAGVFGSRRKAERYAAYLRTQFVRFLVSLRKVTQDSYRRVYGFVPDVPLDRMWTDQDLYARYGLSADEIAFIEETVRPMDESDD